MTPKPLTSSKVYEILGLDKFITNIGKINRNLTGVQLPQPVLENITSEISYKLNVPSKNIILEKLKAREIILVDAPDTYLIAWSYKDDSGKLISVANLHNMIRVKADNTHNLNIRSIYAVIQFAFTMNAYYANQNKYLFNRNLNQVAMSVYMRMMYRIFDTNFAIDSTPSGNIVRFYINKFFLLQVLGGDPKNMDSINEQAYQPLRQLMGNLLLQSAIGNEVPGMYDDLEKFIDALRTSIPTLKDLDMSIFLRSFLSQYGEKALLMIENYPYLISYVISVVSSGMLIRDFAMESVIGKDGTKLYTTFMDLAR